MSKIQPKQIDAGNDSYVLTTTGTTVDWLPLSAITNTVDVLNDLNDVTTGLPTTLTQADDGKMLFLEVDTGQWITDDTVTHGTSVINGKKASAGTITIGAPVYLIGLDSDLHTVELADATSSATMPSIGLAAETLDNTNSKHIMTFGKLQGVDTSSASTINPGGESWSVSDDLYVSTTAGGLTNVRPVGASTRIQRIAKVLKVGTSDGQLFVFNTARDAGLPNLTENLLWAGNSNNQPAETSSVLSADLTNERVGIGTSSPSQRLTVRGSGTGATINTIWLDSDGTTNIAFRDNSAAIFNQSSNTEADFRIKGGTQPHQFLLDAGLDRIGIQESAPEAVLHIQGGSASEPTLQVGKTGDTGFFTYVDGNQADGFVLTSDAKGNATWQEAGGGGVSKYATTSAFTSNVTQTITHGLGTSDIVVELWDNAASPARVDAEVTQTNGSETTALDITFSVSGTYKIVVIG